MKSFSLRKRSITLVGVSFAFFSFLSVKILLSEVSTHAATQTASQTVGPNTISMSNDDSVAIAVIPTSEQTVYTGTNALSVTNSCPSGATITLTTNSNSDTSLSNKLVRSGSDDLTKEINPTTGNSLVNNSWGYSINNGANYYAVPTKDGTPATIYDSSSATSGIDTVNVKYGIKMNHDLPSGNYSNDVVYTVAVKPACLSYTLKWDLNGGTGKTGTDYSDTQISYGENINLTNYTPTREGFVFNGWSDGTTTFTGNETSVNINEGNARTITLKAEWTANAPVTFSYTGAAQSWTVPINGRYKVELWGASGGDYSATYHGGLGAYVSGEILLKKDSKLYISVGQAGHLATSASNRYGGWNGGGGTYGNPTQTNAYYNIAGTGGGSTDIRVLQPTYSLHTTYYSYIGDSNSNSSRIMVAAGGGGGSYGNIDGWSGYSVGGNGGGLSGDVATGSYWGNQHVSNGGTQTAGGQGWYDGSHADSYVNGNFAVGGAQGWAPWGGGGSGWYGGSGGGGWTGPGAGGSSYISGHTGCVGITSTNSQAPKAGCTTGTTNNNCSLTPFTNPATNAYYTFTNTTMVDGGGYEWTTSKGSKTNMPNTAGTGNEAGHTGNGYAKITYLGA